MGVIEVMIGIFLLMYSVGLMHMCYDMLKTFKDTANLVFMLLLIVELYCSVNLTYDGLCKMGLM